MVVTAFILLDASQVKHGYDLDNTVRIAAPYVVYCGGDACNQISQARQNALVWGPTTIIRDYGAVPALTDFLARQLNVSSERLVRAASNSVTHVWDRYELAGHNCPSADLILIWISKCFLIRDAMGRHPMQQLFAWVDAGFNEYRPDNFPPQAPWLRFQPTPNAIAVRFFVSYGGSGGTCHNYQRSTRFSHCVYGAFFYGYRAAWDPYVTTFANHLRRLVETQDEWIAGWQKMLCSDQDLMTDVAARVPWLLQELLPRDRWSWHDITSISKPGLWARDGNFPGW